MRPEKYTQANNRGDKTRQHRVIAERILGRPLPDGAQVHHVDFNGRNNAHSNLVICPSQAYHLLLHTRTKALQACGNADWRPCVICKKYDDPAVMALKKVKQKNSQQQYNHFDCAAEYQRRRARKK